MDPAFFGMNPGPSSEETGYDNSAVTLLGVDRKTLSRLKLRVTKEVHKK